MTGFAHDRSTKTVSRVIAFALTSTFFTYSLVGQVRDIDHTPAEIRASLGLKAKMLPDAPSTSLADANTDPLMPTSDGEDAPHSAFRPLPAPTYATAVEPGYQARHLGTVSKGVYGIHELVSYRFPVEVIISAGLSHADDKNPNYGTNSEAFAKRVGAAGARQASQIVFSDMLLAPLFHEDPRYYVMGPGHSPWKRLSYAATRVLLTRTDGGKTTPNLSLLAGYGGSAALTQLYYPVRSRGISDTFSGYGLSLGGRAIGYEFSEFFRFLGGKQPR